MPSIQVVNGDGIPMTIQCDKIVSVDGVPYMDLAPVDDLTRRVDYLEGQIDTLGELFKAALSAVPVEYEEDDKPNPEQEPE